MTAPTRAELEPILAQLAGLAGPAPFCIAFSRKDDAIYQEIHACRHHDRHTLHTPSGGRPS